LKTRIVTGLLFGLVLIGSIFLSEYSCALLLLVILAGSVHEFRRLLSPLEIQPQGLLTYLLNFSVFAACIFIPVAWQSAQLGQSELLLGGLFFTLLVLLISTVEIFRKRKRPIENVAGTVFSAFYLALPLGLLFDASIDEEGAYAPVQVLFFFLFMWASDTGAYFSGMAFGKHKLLERISPKKTVEGFIGGVVLAMLTGAAAYYFIGRHTLPFWLGSGALLALSGTLGDLFESMIKRQAGIKDSGNILPGHGGFLDRFDSTFLSAPLYFFIIHTL